MAKVTNIFGELATGKNGPVIYQGHYGRTIRRAGYSQKNKPTQAQTNARNMFKEATAWASSLSFDEKTAIKNYYNKTFNNWEKGQPSTWHNFAKSIYIKKPTLILLDSTTQEYLINHPAIKTVSIYNDIKQPLFQSDDISSFETGEIVKEYPITIPKSTFAIGVTTLAGLEYIRFLTNISHFNKYECFTTDCACDS
jgi:hypothetical protein